MFAQVDVGGEGKNSWQAELKEEGGGFFCDEGISGFWGGLLPKSKKKKIANYSTSLFPIFFISILDGVVHGHLFLVLETASLAINSQVCTTTPHSFSQKFVLP